MWVFLPEVTVARQDQGLPRQCMAACLVPNSLRHHCSSSMDVQGPAYPGLLDWGCFGIIFE